MFKTRKLVLAHGRGSARLFIAVVFVLVAGLSAIAHAGTRSVEGFEIDRVVLQGSDELKITWSDENRLLVKGDEDDLEKQPFYVKGRTLYLGRSQRGSKVHDLKYLLEVDRLERIELKGSGTIWVEPVDTDSLTVKLDGSGDIRVHSVNATGEFEVSVAGSGNVQVAEITAESIDAEVSGSGDLDFGEIKAVRVELTLNGSGDIIVTKEGAASDLEIDVAGSGDIELTKLQVERADVSIVGSGDVFIRVNESLDASIIGSGDVSYEGDADVDSSILGSGSVSRDD